MGENCCKQINETNSEFLTTITNIETQRNSQREKEYTTLKGKYLFNGKIICKFINYNILKQFAKFKYDALKKKLDKHFCFISNEKIQFNEEYFIKTMNEMINKFFLNKEIIKFDAFKDDNLMENLHNFEYLKLIIKKNYIEEICNNKINFYSNFIKYVNDKKSFSNFLNLSGKYSKLKDNIKKIIYIKKMLKIKSEDEKMNNNDFDFKNEENEENKISKSKSTFIKEKSEEETKNIKANREFIEKDIDNLFKMILNKENVIEKKLKDFEFDETSFLLLLLSEELNYNTQIFITGKLRKFIKVFYNIYLLKHYNFMSNTGEDVYFKVNKTKINKYLKDPKYFFDIDNKETYKEMDKKELFKKLFNDNNNNSSNNNSNSNICNIKKTKTKTKNKKVNFLNDSNTENDEDNKSVKQFVRRNSRTLTSFDIHTMKLQKQTNNENIQRKKSKFDKNDSTLNNYFNDNNENDEIDVEFESEKNLIVSKEISPKKSPKKRKILRGKTRHSLLTFDIKKIMDKSDLEISSQLIKNERHGSQINLNKLYNKDEKILTKKTKFYSEKNFFKNEKFDFYSGQYDNNIYKYSGLGTLIKQRKSSCYTGTFRYGKKEGFGIYYKHLNEKHIVYYMGEFYQNKFNGFGIYIEINDNLFLMKKGNFNEKKFLSGEFINIFYDNKLKNLNFIKYEGDFDENNKYNNYGHLIKQLYNYNEKKENYELENDYEYKGFFINGFENGKSYLKCNFKNKGYYYEYNGDFKNGLKNGFGIIKYSPDFFIKSYEGFFLNDEQFNCYGIVNFKSGDKYEGFFNDNMLKDNVGLYYYYDHDLKRLSDNYFGLFRNDRKDGFGRFIMEKDGLVKLLYGTYLNGMKDGYFNLVYEEEDVKKKEKFEEENKNHNSNNMLKTFKNLFKFSKDEKLRKFYVKKQITYLFDKNDLLED